MAYHMFSALITTWLSDALIEPHCCDGGTVYFWNDTTVNITI
jgi:hypothetical protein